MKILLLIPFIHHKNEYALKHYTKINITTISCDKEMEEYDLNQFDCVYSPSEPIDVSLYPNTKFIFGPHFSVLPNEKMLQIKGQKNVIYNCLCEWVKNSWKKSNLCEGVRFVPIPFGIDTLKFQPEKPIQKRTNAFVYVKSRSAEDLDFVQQILYKYNIDYTIFSYRKRYNEEEYINCLKNAKFGIWLDAHESQGFALQEALSCNVPLLVWNIKSMNQEYNSSYPNIRATTIPYWDARCGEFFYFAEQMEITLRMFLSKLEHYTPRNFILENLSMEVCERRLMEYITNFYDI